jgi:N-acetylmuramoyl-L-alanine amidase
MKKLLLICLVGLLTAFPLFAGQKKEVALRFSQHDNSVRVVFESDDNSIRNSIIIATLSNIKIEFPEPVELKKPRDFVFETSVTDRILSIKLKNAEDVSYYKLGGPSRIVIDLKVAQKLPAAPQAPMSEKPKQTPKTGAEMPTVSPAPQKLPSGAQPQTGEKPKQTPKTGAEMPTVSPAPQKLPSGVQSQIGEKPKQAPQAAVKPAASKVIFLDPGHGGYDYGLIAKDSKEKDLDLLLTKDLSAALAKVGSKVFLTRKVDQSLSIRERTNLVNSKKPDIFISMHSSASNVFAIYTTSVEESGTESAVSQYSLSARQSRHIEKSRALAKAFGSSLKAEFKGDIFERELPLPLLSSMDSAAVLIEYPSLQMNTYDPKMRDRVISAIVKGIQAYE